LKRLQFRKCLSFFILMSCLLVLHGSLHASALCCKVERQIANDPDTCCSCCGPPSNPTTDTLSTLTAYPISDHCLLCYDISFSSSPDKCYISSQNILPHLQALMSKFISITFKEMVSESFPSQPPPLASYMRASLSTIILLI